MPADTLDAPPVKPQIKIPSFKGGKPTQEPAKPPAPAETPPPAHKPADVPPGAPKEPVIDVSDIPTDISGKKSASQYAEERREAKLKRAAEQLGVPALQQEADETKTLYAETKLQLEKERQERAADAQRLLDLQKIAEERKADLEKRDTEYFDRFSARFDPNEDEELRSTSAELGRLLVEKMPIRVPGTDGEKRVKFEDVLRNPVSARNAERALEDFTRAREAGDDNAMNMAVNFMALQMGADVFFSPTSINENRLLSESDPAFVKIEEAMVAAMPSFVKKKGREQFVSEQAPVLVQEQLRKRESSIASNLRAGIFLNEDTRNSIAAQNPMDGRVILSSVLEASPQLKEEADRYISVNAPALARMGSIQMPTLTSKDPAAIQAHRQEQARYQRQLGEMTANAVIGHLSSMIIAEMAGELEALRARADDIASNENPGGTRHTDDGGGGGVTDVSQIPTKIVPSRPR